MAIGSEPLIVQLSQDTPFSATRLRPGLGTLVAIEALANSPEISDLSVAAGFEAIAAVERLMHPTRSGSDLAALRDAPLHAPLSVHAWTFAVLELCKQFHRLSAGVFDPCLPTSPGRLGDLELNAPHDVTAHARLHLDLGGIAKGYAVDRAIEALRRAGCVGGLVNAGGDLATYGEPEREIRCRHSNGRSVIVNLRDAALATSDTEQASPPAEHQGYYHGIRRSVRPRGYAAVMAPDAATADALTKCLLADGDTIAIARLLSDCGARRIEFADEE
jgi:thiamine biosynthesis lipoprotein